MAKTTVDAKVYIARVIGGAQSPGAIDAAGEALLSGYGDWQTMRNWDFLLKDTSLTTAVTGVTATQSVAVVNAPSSGAFDFVNVGQTVTISAGTAILAVPTSVLSFTRNSDGTIATITLSNSFTGTTNTNATLTFSANIHVTTGVNDYNLPRDYYEAYTARFITNSKRPLQYRRQRHWDKTQWDQSVQGTPEEYTTYNPYSDGTQNHGTEHMKFDRIPQQDDDLFLRYYRTFTVDGTYVDVPDRYLQAFLDYCRGLALEAKRAQENPTAYLASVKDRAEKSGEDDEEVEDSDDSYMKSQYEAGASRRPIVGNGDFWPTMGG